MPEKTKIKMIKPDVSIEPLEDEVCDSESDRCTTFITHAVWVDFRSAGVARRIGTYCETCATEIMKRIQETLPDDDGTQ